jgi:hypothetical protein
LPGEIALKYTFLKEKITYTGCQLSSHWIFNHTQLTGDAIVSFAGPADVPLNNMVDLEDVRAKEHIYSENMLHFLVEHFDSDLEKAILRQRLLICMIQNELAKASNVLITRKGDDLFVNDLKLTVSIATASPVSSLIHTGINISNRNTPVPTYGLENMDIDPTAFAGKVMSTYMREIDEIHWARCKVRAVS